MDYKITKNNYHKNSTFAAFFSMTIFLIVLTIFNLTNVKTAGCSIAASHSGGEESPGKAERRAA